MLKKFFSLKKLLENRVFQKVKHQHFLVKEEKKNKQNIDP